MVRKIEYTNADSFMYNCALRHELPAIRWREGLKGYKGYIYFRAREGYIVEKGEVHLFYSYDKKLLDAIFNSIELISHAMKLVHEVK